MLALNSFQAETGTELPLALGLLLGLKGIREAFHCSHPNNPNLLIPEAKNLITEPQGIKTGLVWQQGTGYGGRKPLRFTDIGAAPAPELRFGVGSRVLVRDGDNWVAGEVTAAWVFDEEDDQFYRYAVQLGGDRGVLVSGDSDGIIKQQKQQEAEHLANPLDGN
ncbi:expressed unknown protein [Seminavis robusta]|uniref:Uncharacterized protein n=1 Tax=Seminavis robusta TaxID=568900 RepID=A0A9N8HYS1_9STRA|nr:expressed unknown protein [Seminavis robusta]|eukprot:Sro2064_g313140.1 n/a (164) ;mRNA; f:7153-7850